MRTGRRARRISSTARRKASPKPRANACAQKLDGHGLGRHRDEEIAELGGRSIDALAALLGDKHYLFGDTPCGADATAFAFAAGVLTPFFDTPLRRRAEGHPNLAAYRERMMRRYYPEFVRKAA